MSEDLLEALGEEERQRLLDLCHPRHYPVGSTVFNEGEISDRVVVLIAGLVKVSFYTDEGKEVLLGVRGKGSILGEMAALDGQPRSATVTTLTDVESAVLGADDFRTFLTSDPEITMSMLAYLTSRLRDADRKRVEFGALDTTGRLATRLLELADRFGEETDDGTRIDISLSQQDLAGWTGSSREAVSKSLRALRKRSIVRTDRRQITILDRPGLEKRAR